MSELPVPEWLAGFLLIPTAWIAAGVVATLTSNAEQVFPRAFLSFVVLGLVAVIVRAIRQPATRRSLLLGSLGSLAAAATIWVAILLGQP